MHRQVPGRTAARTITAGLIVALASLAVMAAPASADPAKPTNFRSQVLTVTPATDVVNVEVRGNDAFLSLTAKRGHEVVVYDYGSSTVPYLRFDPDGKVTVNVSSNAYKVNDSFESPAAGDSQHDSSHHGMDPAITGPRWRTVASDGQFAWHDHRIHWMADQDRATVNEYGRVDMGGYEGRWEVDISVDDMPTVVAGELTLHSPIFTPITATMFVAILSVVLIFGAVAARDNRYWVLGAVLAVVSAGAAFVAVAERVRAPVTARPSPVALVVAAIALGASVASLVAHWRGGRHAGSLGSVAAAAIFGFSFVRRDMLVTVFTPSGASHLDRTVVAVGLAVSIAAAAQSFLAPRPTEQTPADHPTATVGA